MKNLSISFKLICSIGALACGYLLFLVLVEWTGTQLRHHLEIASDSLFPAALASQESVAAFNKLNQDYKDAIITQNPALLTAADEDSKRVSAQLQIIQTRTSQDAVLQQRLAAILAELSNFSTRSKETYAKMLSSPDAMDDQLMATVKELAAESSSLSKSLQELSDIIGKTDFQNELSGITRATRVQRLLTLGLFCVAITFAGLTIFLLQRQIAQPLRRAVDVLGTAAEGDLTASLNVGSTDEVGKMARALNDTFTKLRAALLEVSETARHANATSRQLDSASGVIANGAQAQASSLQETSASLEQITATVRNTADNARQASQLAAASAESAIQGQDVVAKAIVAMSEIDAASRKIFDIISTIDEIAFQTNLLAVNAAVEAARAGDEGRGFAVVASEVRSLAQRSAVAAKEIKSLIQDSVHKVQAGSSLVNRSGETLQGIVGSVKRVTDIVAEIAAASAEQTAGIEQVNSAMMQMDNVTQSNSAQTEELTATAESLSKQAEHLLELIRRFRLGQQEDADVKIDFRAALKQSGTVQPAGKRANRPVGESKGKSKRSKGKVRQPASLVRASSAAVAVDDSFEEF